MLTKRENLLETIRGGHPDRFVNQFEAFSMINNPLRRRVTRPKPGGPPVKDLWGVTMSLPIGTPGQFPVHDAEHIVLKDITHWQDYVKAPSLDFSEEEWAPLVEAANTVDRNEQFVTPMFAPGIFEQMHHLMSIQEAFVAFYDEPDCVKELLHYITDFELQLAEQVCNHLHPDALFHHDDWGSQISSFFSPEMFRKFFVPEYKRLYGYYRDQGVEVIVHHSDSYAANLVPDMIDIGIDIWQGCLTTNNIPELIRNYGSAISFMGGINNGVVDISSWTPELIEQEVDSICSQCSHYFIPNTTMGGPSSIFPGVYDAVTKAIDRASKKYF